MSVGEAGTAGMRERFEQAFLDWAKERRLCLNSCAIIGEPMRYSAQTEEAKVNFHAGWQAASLTQKEKEEIARRVVKVLYWDDSARTEKDALDAVLAIINEVLGGDGK